MHLKIVISKQILQGPFFSLDYHVKINFETQIQPELKKSKGKFITEYIYSDVSLLIN